MASSNPKSKYNQPVADPLAHFKAIPWCNDLLSQKSIVSISTPDRTPLASTESAMVRETCNTPDTVNACVTYLRYIKPESKEAMIARGESKENPFLEVGALCEVGRGFNGYAGTAHGGFFGVVLDEVLGTAANLQSKNGAYTASLTVDMKKPLMTPAVVIVRGRVAKIEGKKIFMQGSFKDKDGNVLAEARGLWVMMGRDIGRWTTKEQRGEKEKEAEERRERRGAKL